MNGEQLPAIALVLRSLLCSTTHLRDCRSLNSCDFPGHTNPASTQQYVRVKLTKLAASVNACVILRPNNFDPPCDFLSNVDTLQDSHSVFQPHSSSVRLPHPAAGRLHLDM